jgi:glycerate kinase
MRIVIAPDSFKGSLSSKEVADAIELGVRKVLPDVDIVKIPIADGGEGTVQTLVAAMGGEIIKTQVVGPLGETIESYFGVLNDKKTAIIEMANASGLPLVPIEKRNPLITTSYGTGQLIKAALDMGVDRIVIGLGGSATNDGGVGMAQALGIRIFDENGNDIGFGGGELSKIRKIDMSGIDDRIRKVRIEAACDVDNPLCGPNGASYIYGPQKGANKEMIEILDRNLGHLAKVIKRDLGADIMELPGAGAAGGLGAGLLVERAAERVMRLILINIQDA